MAGLTKEQRAEREAQKAVVEQDAKDHPNEPKLTVGGDVMMERDGKTTEVRAGPSIELMQALGWKVV